MHISLDQLGGPIGEWLARSILYVSVEAQHALVSQLLLTCTNGSTDLDCSSDDLHWRSGDRWICATVGVQSTECLTPKTTLRHQPT